MTKIYVDFNSLNESNQSLKKVYSNVNSLKSNITSIVRNMDWEIDSTAELMVRARKIELSLDAHTNRIKNYITVLDNAYAVYKRVNEGDNKKQSKVVITINTINHIPSGTKTVDPTLSFAEILKEMLREYLDDLFNGKGFNNLDILNALSGGLSKIFKDKGAGLFKDASGYLNDLFDFYNEGATGINGLGNWFHLGDSSIGVWTGLYDFYKGKLKDGEPIPQLFSDANQGRVEKLGLAGDVFGLIGTLLNASSDLDEKTLGNIMADYAGAGNNILDIVNSATKLNGGNESKSLYNPTMIYTSIFKSAIASFQQAFRSIDKYSADGVWTADDTGATGVDSTVAGIYTLGHTLTFGLDDLIYGAIDRATGGSPSDDLNFMQKAAEGYKIAAREIGNWIGEKINSMKKH